MRLASICVLVGAVWPAHATVPPPEAAPRTFVMAALDARVPLTTGNARRSAAQGKSPLPGAAEKPPASAPARPSPLGRARLPVVAATATGPGQSGYVHYFELELPDGVLETLVGVELADGRIAWSFPELGVVVSPFIRSGEVEVNGRTYALRHQYGMRPFPDDESMRVLQKELASRVAFWIEDGTPYCNPPVRGDRPCLSCLGLVLHVLFPGSTPAHPALPRDFGRSGAEGHYSTDDLLVYLAGLESLRTPAARMQRIDSLALPPALRRDLVQLVEAMDAGNRVADSAKGAPRSLNEKTRPGFRTYSRTPPQRKRL
jgi:hypothetical protein